MGFFDDLFGGKDAKPVGSMTGGTGPGSESDLVRRADDIERTEYGRYGEGKGFAVDAFKNAQTELSKGIDTDLLYGKALDSSGAQARSSVESLRSSLGARGLNPNSGAAQGMLSQMALQQTGQLVGAKRDIALADRETRQKNAAVNFANALNLAGYINSPVPQIGLDTSTSIFEGNLAREGMANQMASNNAANKTNILGAGIGAAGSVLAGLI